MSDQRELELRALRQACPVAWTAWARTHGSPTLQRAITEGYPYEALLRMELIDLFCPAVPGAERLDEIAGCRGEIGEERAPHEVSFAMLDRIHEAALSAYRGPKCPLGTELTLLRLRRARLFISDAPVIHASAAGVEIACGLMSLTVTYIWGRSDR